MKFILFDISNEAKSVINKIELNDSCSIDEVVISKKQLDMMAAIPNTLIKKIKYKLQDRQLEKIILQALSPYNKKWYYILSNNFQGAKYLTDKAQSLLGYNLPMSNELNNNIFKYINEYIAVDNIKAHQVKVLIVANNEKNIDITMMGKLIGEYKQLDIYLKAKPSSYFSKRINDINIKEGTTIDILKNDKKAFAEYNVIYFVDDFRKNYPRFRLSKKSLIVDLSLVEGDKFNSNLIFMNGYLKNVCARKENIELLLTKYNAVQLATVVKETINSLDKL